MKNTRLNYESIWKNSNFHFSVFFRFVLSILLPQITEFCRNRPEINNSATSLKQLREGVFLAKNGVDVFKYGKIQQPPLVMLLIAAIEPFQFITQFFFHLLDYIIAALLYHIVLSDSSVVFQAHHVALAHLFNPFSIMAAFGENLGILNTAAQLAALTASIHEKEILAAVFVAIAAYLDIYSLAFMFPCAFILNASPRGRTRFVFKCLGILSFLHGVSGFTVKLFLKTDSPFDYLRSVYYSRLLVEDLRPNSGLHWYLFTQVFANFQPLLKLTAQTVSIMFIAPIVIKFRNDPMFMAFLLSGIQSVLKSYPSVADYSLMFALLWTQSAYFERTRLLIFALFVAAGVFIFKLRIWTYWIEVNGLNANFYYIFTLLWNVSLIFILLEMVVVHERAQIYRDNPILQKEELKKCKLFQR